VADETGEGHDTRRGLVERGLERPIDRCAHWCQTGRPTPSSGSTRRSSAAPASFGIFPNNAAVIRLLGGILLDMHDEWVAAERRYLSEGSVAKLYTTAGNELVAALEGGA